MRARMSPFSHALSHAYLPARNPLASGSRTIDRKSTRLNSSHLVISYAVFCLKKKNDAEQPAADHHLLHGGHGPELSRRASAASAQPTRLHVHVDLALQLQLGRYAAALHTLYT